MALVSRRWNDLVQDRLHRRPWRQKKSSKGIHDWPASDMVHGIVVPMLCYIDANIYGARRPLGRGGYNQSPLSGGLQHSPVIGDEFVDVVSE